MLPKRNNLPLGSYGEDVAEGFLKSHGYTIIQRNFRQHYSEIDIVAIYAETLVFVEVKTRRSNKFGTPFEAITRFKLHSLIKSAYYYKMLHPELPGSLRIDLISIVLKNGNSVEKIDHIKNISGF